MDARSDKLISSIEAVSPGFRAFCLSDESPFLNDDGPVNIYRIWSAFTDFVRDSIPAMSDSQIATLGAFVNAHANSNDDDWANAAFTCFLENFAGDPGTERLGATLTGDARKWWKVWGGA